MAGFKNIVAIVGSAAAGFIASVVKVGVQLTNRFELIASAINTGVSSSATQHSARIEQKPAIQTSLLGAEGQSAVSVNPAVAATASLRDAGLVPVAPAASIQQSLRTASGHEVKPGILTSLLGAIGIAGNRAVNPAVSISAVLRDYNVPQAPAAEIVQIKYDLTKRAGGNSVTETAVGGRTDWASDANATGIHDGSNATFAGNALGARGGQLELSYANSVGKSELTITSAILYFYGSVAGTLANNADVQLKYDIGTGFVTLETITGDANFLTTPKSHDITAALNTWAEFDALRTAVSASSAIAETWTANLDAVEIEILATRTESV